MCGVMGVIKCGSSAQALAGSDGVISAQDLAARAEESAAYQVYKGLLMLQHRGQDAAGILSFDFSDHRFHLKKNLGLVGSVFKEGDLQDIPGPMAIGHNRYATMGGDGLRDVQPMALGHPYGIGLGHNGNLVNYRELKELLEKKYKAQLLTANDAEILLQLWGQLLVENIGQGGDFNFEDSKKATFSLFEKAKGAYSVVGLVAGEGMFAFRDPWGIRPLVLGKKTNADGEVEYSLASETGSLRFLQHEYVREIKPGEYLFIHRTGKIDCAVMPLPQTQKASPCMFEWVYFAGAEGVVGDKAVYSVRLRLGELLAKKVSASMQARNWRPDIIMPVPDTSRSAGLAMAEALAIPYREGLIKNRYIQRSFILSEQEKREKAVELKLIPVVSEIVGKSILLVDDSIVRGTTSKKIVGLLKSLGAREVHLAITCPPIRHACFYGIDYPEKEQLLAGNRSEEQMAQWIGCQELVFLDTDDLHQAIGKNDLCLGCLNGNYPVGGECQEKFGQDRQKYKLKENKQ